MSSDAVILQLSVDCAEINQRLIDCHEQSSLGFYENALELSERTPSLMAEVTRVNSRISLLRSSQPDLVQLLDSEPRLQINQAYLDALQECYDKVSQLKTLARSLRRLVLARALLPSRLSVMREMLSIDPSHPFMDGDIRAHERAWYRQVVEYCMELARNSQTSRIEEIIEDFRNSGYAEPIPALVVTGVKEALKKSRLTRLPLLESEIKAAHEARDLTAIQLKFTELDQLLNELNHSDAELDRRLDPVRRWMLDCQSDLNLEQEKVDAVADLEKLIQQSNVASADVAAQLQKAESLGVVDDVLRARAQAKMAKSATRQKTNWLAMAAAGLIIATAVPTLYLLLTGQSRHNNQVMAALENVNSGPRRNQKLDEAASYLDGLPVNVKSDQRVVGLRSEIENEKRELSAISEAIDKLRAAEPVIMHEDVIQETTSEAENRIASMQKKKLENGSDLFDLAPAQTALRSAAQSRQNRNQQAIREREQRIEEELATCINQCATVRTALLDGSTSVVQVSSKFTELQQQKTTLAQDNDKLPSAAFTHNVGKLDEQLSMLQASLQLTKEAANAIESIQVAGVTDKTLQDLFVLRQRLASDRKDEPLSTEVRHAYLAIKQLSGGLSKATANAQSYKTLTDKLPKSLAPVLAGANAELLKAVARKNFRAEFARTLERPDLSLNLWIARVPGVDERNQNHGYFLSKAKPSPGMTVQILGGREEPPFPNTPGVDARPAPQLEYRTQASKIIENSNSPYALFSELYRKLRSDGALERVDPILRLSLVASLKQTLQRMSTGASRQLQSQNLSQLDLLATSLDKDIRNSTWALDQAYGEYDRKRQICLAALNELPKDLVIEQTVAELDATLVQRAETPLQLVGVYAAKTASEPVVLHSKVALPDYSHLMVVDPSPPHNVVNVQSIQDSSKYYLLPVIGIVATSSGSGQ